MAFEIDERPKTLSFTGRLARENGWSLTYARRVIDEYKRFIFLCMEAGHPCTPSDQVDQAWHLHLTYTKSYWDRLNGEVLPRPLHHNPTEGGAREDAKFDDWYARTRESYERHFGVSPPADIWPPSEVRFGEDPYAARVNLRRNWVIPKRTVLAAGACLGLGLLTAGCTQEEATVALFAMVIFSSLAGFMIYALVSGLKPGRKQDGAAGCGAGGSGCGGESGGGYTSADGSSGCSSSGCGGGGCGGGCGGGD